MKAQAEPLLFVLAWCIVGLLMTLSVIWNVMVAAWAALVRHRLPQGWSRW